MRKIAAAALLAAFTCVPLTHALAADTPCTNEGGDISVGGIIGVDHPGSNGYYAVCVNGKPTGVQISQNPGTCVAIIVNGTRIGCS